MRIHLVLIAAVASLASCAGPSGPRSVDDISSSFVREFERKYSEYRIAPDRLPVSNLKEVAGIRKQPIWKSASVELTLHLGNRTGDGSGRFRTSSRYELRSTSGALLSSAESVLASEDLNDSDLQPSVRIAFDPTSRKLLVVEEHSWSAGRIIILPIDDGPKSDSYVRLPSRRSLEPFDHYEIVSFSDGKIFMKQDGALFAFPLDALQSYTDLDYSIGATSPKNPAQQDETQQPLSAALFTCSFVVSTPTL